MPTRCTNATPWVAVDHKSPRAQQNRQTETQRGGRARGIVPHAHCPCAARQGSPKTAMNDAATASVSWAPTDVAAAFVFEVAAPCAVMLVLGTLHLFAVRWRRNISWFPACSLWETFIDRDIAVPALCFLASEEARRVISPTLLQQAYYGTFVNNSSLTLPRAARHIGKRLMLPLLKATAAVWLVERRFDTTLWVDPLFWIIKWAAPAPVAAAVTVPWYTCVLTALAAPLLLALAFTMECAEMTAQEVAARADTAVAPGGSMQKRKKKTRQLRQRHTVVPTHD